jgi:glucose-6-phosphate 1-dehydrogenase
MDTCRGDQTLFMRGDELEAAWAWVDDIIADWDESKEEPLEYTSGGPGPLEATKMMSRDGRSWEKI